MNRHTTTMNRPVGGSSNQLTKDTTQEASQSLPKYERPGYMYYTSTEDVVKMCNVQEGAGYVIPVVLSHSVTEPVLVLPLEDSTECTGMDYQPIFITPTPILTSLGRGPSNNNNRDVHSSDHGNRNRTFQGHIQAMGLGIKLWEPRQPGGAIAPNTAPTARAGPGANTGLKTEVPMATTASTKGTVAAGTVIKTEILNATTALTKSAYVATPPLIKAEPMAIKDIPLPSAAMPRNTMGTVHNSVSTLNTLFGSTGVEDGKPRSVSSMSQLTSTTQSEFRNWWGNIVSQRNPTVGTCINTILPPRKPELTPVGQKYIESIRNELGDVTSFHCRLCHLTLTVSVCMDEIQHMKTKKHRHKYMALNPKIKIPSCPKPSGCRPDSITHPKPVRAPPNPGSNCEDYNFQTWGSWIGGPGDFASLASNSREDISSMVATETDIQYEGGGASVDTQYDDEGGETSHHDDIRPWWEGTTAPVLGRAMEEEEGEPDVARSENPETIVIMPEVGDQWTRGEEGDVLQTLFRHRVMLFCYHSDSKQWKERGVGEIKIVKNTEKGSFRLLMHREQVLRLACNHSLTSDLPGRPLLTSDTAWCWTAMDYTQPVGKMEHFAVDFQRHDIAQAFRNTFLGCQEECRKRQNSPAPSPP